MIKLKWRKVNNKWTTNYLGLQIRQTNGIKRYGSKVLYVVTSPDKEWVLDSSTDLINVIMFCHKYKPKKQPEKK
jgi:hypothetical protein